MSGPQTHVVVLGGGYAGVMAANRLMSRDDVRVTLVNPRPRFVERIRLHQLAAGNHGAAEDYAAVLNPEVRLVVGSAERIDVAARRVWLGPGPDVDALDYDYLVYAVGSTGVVADAVPGAAEFAYPLSELEQAERLRDRLADLAKPAPVVVVGGGLTGIETAAEFAEAGRTVTLVSPVVGPSLSRPGRRSVLKRLDRLGVTTVSAAVASVAADHVVLSDGRALPSAVTVWTTGFGVPGLAAASGLTTDGLGRLRTDETLTSVDDDRIVAAGDAVAPSGVPYRMSCQAGLPLGAQAAGTVLARISGSAAPDATVPMSGECISLGRGAGTVQLHRRDDTPVNLYIGGRTGAFVKEQVCRYTLKFLGGEARKPGSYRSLKGPDRSALIPTEEMPAR